uniref:(northern house mosquito) hypothetical protein n=1 Tax=Culex pipiens TaxID=7175 RepID=A0A8D8IKC7_CULPI
MPPKAYTKLAPFAPFQQVNPNSASVTSKPRLQSHRANRDYVKSRTTSAIFPGRGKKTVHPEIDGGEKSQIRMYDPTPLLHACVPGTSPLMTTSWVISSGSGP